jgi:hypothetical protein
MLKALRQENFGVEIRWNTWILDVVMHIGATINGSQLRMRRSKS